jgi:hypothetical protein
VTHDVFVSYSHGDKSTADAVVAGLEQRGIRCWVAPRDIMAGSTWGGAIVDAIAQAAAMVLLLSSESNESRQVLREVERAIATETVVIPFRIEAVETTGAMSYFLGTEHWLDALTSPLEQHIERLATTIGALLSTDTGVERAPQPADDVEPVPAPPGFPPPSSLPAAPPPDRAAPDAPSRSPLIWVGLGVAAVIVIVLIGVALTSGGDDPSAADSTAATTSARESSSSTPTTDSPAATAAPTTAARTTAAPTTVAPTTAVPTIAVPTTAVPTIAVPTTVDQGPPVVLPDGYELYDGSDAGFFLGLPSGWLSFDLIAGDIDALIDEMAGYLSPEQTQGIRDSLDAGVEISMLAFPTDADRNVNVAIVALGPFDTLDVLEAGAEEMVSEIPGSEFVAVERVQLPGAESVIVQTRGTFPDGVADQYQYWVIADRIGYIITFTSFAGGDNELFAEMVQTFGLAE